MVYATPEDLLARYPERDLAQLTDPAGQGIDYGRLRAALADASAEIDRYNPALSPEELRRLCCDIAVYRLMLLRPTGDIEDARRRYEDALRVLESARRLGPVEYWAGQRRLSEEELADYVP
jgi:phage gp36-like protein